MRSVSIAIPRPGLAGVSVSPLIPAVFFILAVSIIYLIGLEKMPYLHNAFHDLRHATGFPCH